MKEWIEKLKWKWPMATHSMCEGCSAPNDIGELIAEIERLEAENEQLKWELTECIKRNSELQYIKQSIESLHQALAGWEEEE